MRRLVTDPAGLTCALPLLAPAAAAVLALAAQACGPSFEAIQEGDLRFAHCDRLDLDPHIAPSHRLHCWREWRRVYTYGQTRDRVEYAQRRIAEVASGDPDPPFELPTGPARPDPGAPTPPSVIHSPPPAVVPAVAQPVAREADAFGPSCLSRCESARAACAPDCQTQPRGCKECDGAYQDCLSNCRASRP